MIVTRTNINYLFKCQLDRSLMTILVQTADNDLYKIMFASGPLLVLSLN
jgi:hypothetical protein